MLRNQRRQDMVVRLYAEIGLGLCGNEVKVGGSGGTAAADWFRFDETPLDDRYKLKC